MRDEVICNGGCIMAEERIKVNYKPLWKLLIDRDISKGDLRRDTKIAEELKIKLSNDDLGKAFFEFLQKGYNVIKLIDYVDISQNSYVVLTELPYENGDDNFRPDIVVLINGMPLSFVEVKRQNNREGILAERERMTRRLNNN